jgi:hypothetical protein
MKSILILQELWRRRIIVGIALMLSILVGATIAYQVTPGLPPHFKSRQFEVGVASARVLVDTPHSIVADLNPSGAASLALHAQLLADLTASEPVRTAIAHSVGIPLQSLAVVPPAVAGAPPVPTPVATAVTPPSGTSTLTMGVDSTLPLVSLSVQAPNQDQAAKLASGAVTALRSYLGTIAAAQKIPLYRQPRITSLGVQSATATRGPSRMFGAAATLVLFSLFCYLVLVVGGAREQLRRARESASSGSQPDATSAPLLDEEELFDNNLTVPPVRIANGTRPAPTGVRERGPHELVAMTPAAEEVPAVAQQAGASTADPHAGATVPQSRRTGIPPGMSKLVSWK